MYYTNIEQSKKLLELELSPETADMYWFDVLSKKPILEVGHRKLITDVPAWSLGALLELIPFDVHLHKLDSRWTISHPNVDSWHRTPLDAAYNMVVWLLENNYIKKEEK